jgi:hypothetical protein
MQGFWDTVTGIFGGGGSTPDEEALQAIQDYPRLAARVATLQADQTAMQIVVSLFEQSRMVNAPASVRAALAELTKTVVVAASNLSELRQKIREGVAAAKQNGTIGAADLKRLEDAGLAGIRTAARAAAATRLAVANNYNAAAYRSAGSNVFASASNPATGIEGLGSMMLPSMLTTAPLHASAARSAIHAGAREARGMRGLGVLPLVVIGYGLALAIAAAIVGGTVVVAWRATAESTARAEAIRDQAKASLDAWQAQVAAQSPGKPAGGLPPIVAPKTLPPLPGIPGEPGGVLAIAARAATPIAVLAALALGGYFLLSRKRN